MSTPEPVVVTPEMRRAVYAADCEQLGHQPDFQNALGGSWGHYMAIGGPDEQTMPHVKCARCGVVWLLWPTEFASYEEAVATVRSKLSAPDELQAQRWPERSHQLREPRTVAASVPHTH